MINKEYKWKKEEREEEKKGDKGRREEEQEIFTHTHTRTHKHSEKKGLKQKNSVHKCKGEKTNKKNKKVSDIAVKQTCVKRMKNVVVFCFHSLFFLFYVCLTWRKGLKKKEEEALCVNL